MSTKQQSFDPIGNVEAPRDRRFYGKYRGRVVSNFDLDPTMVGRLLVYCPQVPGSLLNWALPCTPYAGLGVGFYAMPPVGANVWVEFEGGDPQFPVWSGCFWEPLEFIAPRTANPIAPAMVKMFKTESTTVTINDTPVIGGVKISVMPPAITVPVTIEVNSLGITIETGVAKITVNPVAGTTVTTGPTKVAATPASVDVQTASVGVKAVKTSVTSLVSVTGNTSITGMTDVTGQLSVKGPTGLTGPVTVMGTTGVTGAVTVTGNSTLTALQVTGATTLATAQAGSLTAASVTAGAVAATTVVAATAVTAPTLNGALVPPQV
jgi:hypothetical protein